MKPFFWIICFFLCHHVMADTFYLPENHPVNGGIAIIPLDIKEKPDAYYQKHKLAVLPSINKNQWLLLTGIPLDNARYIQNIDILSPIKALVPFHISDKFYRIQSLVITNNRKVDPYEKDRPRIETEKKKLQTFYETYSHHNPFVKKAMAPVKGPISSLFGLKRIYNGKPRDPHSGLDIAVPTGTPVHVVYDGTVLDASDYFFTGNTVVVDHGLGVISLYAHLNSMDVKKGDVIKQGHVVGAVGMTGRVTGPHLHWMMVMNQTLVDPLLFVPVRIITAVPPKPKTDKAAS